MPKLTQVCQVTTALQNIDTVGHSNRPPDPVYVGRRPLFIVSILIFRGI